MLVRAVRYRVFRSESPNPRFAGRSVMRIDPRCLPSGEMIHTPPGPVVQMFPLESTLVPSVAPGVLSIERSMINFGLANVPSGWMSYRRM